MQPLPRQHCSQVLVNIEACSLRVDMLILSSLHRESCLRFIKCLLPVKKHGQIRSTVLELYQNNSDEITLVVWWKS